MDKRLRELMNLEWHECHMDGWGMNLEGDCLPEDGVYSYWKFQDCTIIKARMKYDAIDHFYPHIPGRKEKYIVAWAKIPKSS